MTVNQNPISFDPDTSNQSQFTKALRTCHELETHDVTVFFYAWEIFQGRCCCLWRREGPPCMTHAWRK